MGFWSGLGKAMKTLGPVAGVVAAPFTGGASLAAITAAGAGAGAAGQMLEGVGSTGQVLGKAAEGSANQRNLENVTRNAFNKTAVDAYKTQNDIAVSNPATFAKQAYVSNMFQNMKNPTVSAGGSGRVPTGLFGAATADQKAAMAEMQRQAMLNLLQSPEKNPVPTAPKLMEYDKQGIGEKLLGTSGLIGQAVGAFAPALQGLFKGDLQLHTNTEAKPLAVDDVTGWSNNKIDTRLLG